MRNPRPIEPNSNPQSSDVVSNGSDAQFFRRLQRISKITVTRTLHDGLGAGEPYIRTISFCHPKVRAACQQEPKLRCANCFVKLSVATASNIYLERLRSLFDYLVIQCICSRKHIEGCSHLLPKIPCSLRSPPLLAILAIQLAERFSDDCIGSLLAQFCLQGFDQRNQNLSLNLRLLNDWDLHRSTPVDVLSPTTSCVFPNAPHK